ncbi:hypothetical protein [Vallitalea guaymasensis]|uniref:hypothetical protein n=1 Tax=Vallitalea guaymasensis TaxID=1185412 RepID=UPI000DE239B0|nr:hypothetical protein [Vallitalea guaymasensis]
MRKFFKGLLLFFVLTIVLTTNIFANNDAVDKMERIFMQQEKSLNSFKQIQDTLKDNKELTESYGGAYIDDEGYLHVNIKQVNKFKMVNDSIKNIKDNNESVKYHYVKKSKKELEAIVNTLNKKFTELEISFMTLSEKDNKVYIWLDDINDIEKQKEISEIIDSNAIEFKQVDKTLSIKIGQGKEEAKEQYNDKKTETQRIQRTKIINGSKCYINNNYSSNGTIGIGVINKSNNKEGFIIPGHINIFGGSYGDTIQYSLTLRDIGIVKRIKFGGSVDATFVECTDYSEPTKIFSGGDSYDDSTSSYLAEGQYITAYGSLSGKQSGRILNINCSYDLEGEHFTDMVQATYMAIKGDSGAAVTYNSPVHSKPIVVGIQSASSLDENDNWTSDSFSLFSKINNIFNEFNLADIY